VTAVLVALRVPGLGFDALLGLLIALVVGIVFGLSLTFRFFGWLGELAGVPADPGYAAAIAGLIAGGVAGLLLAILGWRSGDRRSAGILVFGAVAGAAVGALIGGAIGLLFGAFIADDVRPRATAIIVLAVIGAIAGLIGGLRAGRGGTSAVIGLIAGLVAGLVVGAILGIDYGPRIGAAVAVATFLIAWPVLMLLRLKRQGIDADELKRRFWPQQTIDTTKESIEWAKARLPLGPKS
jgi:MFS family permease